MRRSGKTDELHRRKRNPAKRRPRAGWAEAFEEIGELGEEDRAWLEFGNEGDRELKW